jgi:uracil-DNA glycosylase
VPPANKPEASEVKNCRQFLAARIETLPDLRVTLALGRIAHEATLDALGLKRRDYPFGHGARHDLPDGIVLFDSYHCSRQNTNTGRLTSSMFEHVLEDVVAALG